MRDLPDVINWRRLSNNITLSGQPSEAQLSQIEALGKSHIINLGPHTDSGALNDEAGSVERLGMTYIHIPVDFDSPTESDFQQFCDALEKVPHNKLHVHCIYNARVSAFFYRFFRADGGSAQSEAHAIMDGIWRPGGVWADFIGNESDIELPHRYAGRDY